RGPRVECGRKQGDDGHHGSVRLVLARVGAGRKVAVLPLGSHAADRGSVRVGTQPAGSIPGSEDEGLRARPQARASLAVPAQGRGTGGQGKGGKRKEGREGQGREQGYQAGHESRREEGTRKEGCREERQRKEGRGKG